MLSTQTEFCDLLAECPNAVSAKGFSRHQVLHTGPTFPGPSMFAKACLLDAEKLESARKEFVAMEAARVVCCLCTP